MSGYEKSGRDRIVQPMHPFVEFYLKDANDEYVDILRSADGKPKSLISFMFIDAGNGAGNFTLELYDPEWVAIEDLLLMRAGKEDGSCLVPAIFRFGYVGASGAVLHDPMGKEGYGYQAKIEKYNSSFESWGVRYTLTGMVVPSFAQTPQQERPWAGPIENVVKGLVAKNGWEWDGWIPCPPEDLPLISYGHITTEAVSEPYKQRSKESDWDFLRRIANEFRPKDSELNLLYVNLVTVVPFPEAEFSSGIARPGKPVTVLHTRFQDFKIPSVREYRVLRDAQTEVIRWSPHIDPNIYVLRGGAGSVMRGIDTRLREQVNEMYSEEDAYFKYLKRNTPPTEPLAEDLALGLYAEDEQNEDERLPEDKQEVMEGTRGGREQLRLLNPPDIDAPPHYLTLYGNDRIRMDRAALLHWLGVSMKYAPSAEMEIIGDPKLHFKDHVDVFVYVQKRGTKEVGLHYSSNKYYVSSLIHSISNGSYTCTLGLSVGAFRDNTTGEITRANVEAQEEPVNGA